MSVGEHNILAKVLIAVGGSESSFSALNYGLDLARAANSVPAALIGEEILRYVKRQG